MAARLISFAVLIATIITCSMALKCYESVSGSKNEIECESPAKACFKKVLHSSEVHSYGCDYGGNDGEHDCKDMNDECRHNHTIQSTKLKSFCCCHSDLCNSATLHTQHVLLGVISSIMSLMSLAYIRN
uniref:Uncharacterized protein n=1 Tax=Plectus sambesii TaxID=2011161 RepID=A0A914UKU9_9BILA